MFVKKFNRAIAYLLTFCTVFSTFMSFPLTVHAEGTGALMGFSSAGASNQAFGNINGGILSISEPIIRVGIQRDPAFYNNGTVAQELKSLEEWGHRVPQNTETTLYFVDDVTYDAYYGDSAGVPWCPIGILWYDHASGTLKENNQALGRIKRMTPTPCVDKWSNPTSADAVWWSEESTAKNSVDWFGGLIKYGHQGRDVKHIIAQQLVTGTWWDEKFKPHETDTITALQNSYSTSGVKSIRIADGSFVDVQTKKFADLSVFNQDTGHYVWQDYLMSNFLGPGNSTDFDKRQITAYNQAINNISYFFENVDEDAKANKVTPYGSSVTLTSTNGGLNGFRADKRISAYIAPGLETYNDYGMLRLDLIDLDEATVDTIKAGYLDLLMNFWLMACYSGDPNVSNAWESAINDFLKGSYTKDNPPAIVIDLCTDVVINHGSQGRARGTGATPTWTNFNDTNKSSVAILSVYDYISWYCGTTSAYNMYGTANTIDVAKQKVPASVGNDIDLDVPESNTTGQPPILNGHNGGLPGVFKWCVDNSLRSSPGQDRPANKTNGDEIRANAYSFGASAAAFRFQRMFTKVKPEEDAYYLYTGARNVDYSYINELWQTYGIIPNTSTGKYGRVTKNPSRIGRNAKNTISDGQDKTTSYTDVNYGNVAAQGTLETGVAGFMALSIDIKAPSFRYEFQIDSPVSKVRSYDTMPEVVLGNANDEGRLGENYLRRKVGGGSWHGWGGQPSSAAYQPMGNSVPYKVVDGVRVFDEEEAKKMTYGENVYMSKDGTKLVDAQGVEVQPVDNPAYITAENGTVILTYTAKTDKVKSYVNTWYEMFENAYGPNEEDWDNYYLWVALTNTGTSRYGGKTLVSQYDILESMKGGYTFLTSNASGWKEMRNRVDNGTWPNVTDENYVLESQTGVYQKGWKPYAYVTHKNPIVSIITEKAGLDKSTLNWEYETLGLQQVGLESSRYYMTQTDQADNYAGSITITNFPKYVFWKDIGYSKGIIDSDWGTTDYGSRESRRHMFKGYDQAPGGFGGGQDYLVDISIDEWDNNYLNYTPFDSNGQHRDYDNPDVFWMQEENGIKGGYVHPTDWLKFLNGYTTLAVADYSAIGQKLYMGELYAQDYFAPITVFYRPDAKSVDTRWASATGIVDKWREMSPWERHCSGECKGYKNRVGRNYYCTCTDEGITQDGDDVWDSNYIYKYLYDGWDMVEWHFWFVEPDPEIVKGPRIQIPADQVDQISYSSTPEGYGEIKDNSPKGEKYEVMAGVPTTETLYFATGGSEFKIDLVVEYEPNNTSVWRTYINQYTNGKNGEEAGVTKCEFDEVGKDIWPGIQADGSYKTNSKGGTAKLPTSATGATTPTFDLSMSHKGDKEMTVTWKGDISVTSSKTCDPCKGLQGTESWSYDNYSKDIKAAVQYANSYIDMSVIYAAASDNVKRDLKNRFIKTIKVDGVTTIADKTVDKNTRMSDYSIPDSSTCPSSGANATQGGRHGGCHDGCSSTAEGHTCDSSSYYLASPTKAGNYTITLTISLPDDHMLCGPCCGHVMPQVQDTWKQNLKFDTMRIVSMDIYELTEGKVTGVDELSVSGNKNVYSEIISGNPNIYYNIAEENARNRYQDIAVNTAEKANDPTAAAFIESFLVKPGTYNDWFTTKVDISKDEKNVNVIDNENFFALPYNKTTMDGKILWMYKDRLRHEQGNSSLMGRLRYSFETDSHDYVNISSAKERTRACNGAWHTSCVDDDGDVKTGNVCESINSPKAPSREITANGYKVNKPAGVLLLDFYPDGNSSVTSGLGAYCTGHLTFKNKDSAAPNTIDLVDIPGGLLGVTENPMVWKNAVWGTGIIYNNPIHVGWKDDFNAVALDEKASLDTAGNPVRLNIDLKAYGGNGDSYLDQGEFVHRSYRNSAAVNNGIVEYSNVEAQPLGENEAAILGNTKVVNSEEKKKYVDSLAVTEKKSPTEIAKYLNSVTLDVDGGDQNAAFFYADELDKLTPEWKYFNEKRTTENLVSVISDFLVLQTTSGDQVPLYFEKNNKAIKSQVITAQGIYPYIEATKEEMWDNNINSAANWTKTNIGVGSYNGNYKDVDGKFDGTAGGKIFNTIFDNAGYELRKYMNYHEEDEKLDARLAKLNTDSQSLAFQHKWNAKLSRVSSSLIEGKEMYNNPLAIENRYYAYPRPARPTEPLMIYKKDIEIRETNQNKEYEFGKAYNFYELIESYRGLDKTAGGYVTGFQLTDELRNKGYKADYIKDGVEYAVYDTQGNYLEDCRTYAPYQDTTTRDTVRNQLQQASIGRTAEKCRGILFNLYAYDAMAYDAAGYVYTPEWQLDSRFIRTNRGILVEPGSTTVLGKTYPGEHKGETRLRVGFVTDVAYSGEHTTVNPVILFNPVSVGNAYVDTLPAYRDQRTHAQIDGGAQELMNKLNELKICPRTPGNCEFRILNCKVHDDEVLFDSDFTLVNGKVRSKIKSFANNEEMNKYVENLTSTELAQLILDNTNATIYRSYDVASLGNISGGALTLSNNKLSLPLGKLGLRGITDASNMTLDIIMDVDVSESTLGLKKNYILAGFSSYGYLMGVSDINNSVASRGTWLTSNDVLTTYDADDNVIETLNKNAGYVADETVMVPGRQSIKLTMNTVSLKTNKVYTGADENSLVEISQTQKTKGASVVKYISNAGVTNLYIGGWGKDDKYNVSDLKINSLKIVKKGITEGCTEACFAASSIHASNYPHIHTKDCYQDITNDRRLICGKQEGEYWVPTTEEVKTWTTPGTYTVKLPAGQYKLETWGAQGGGSKGGKGGYSKGVITVKGDTTFTVVVGGKNGYNGGGAGDNVGGGATDVRVDGTTLSNRVIVAGGGGAGDSVTGGTGGGANQNGGIGGRRRGTPGEGGTLTAGGKGGLNSNNKQTCADDGTLGQGGSGKCKHGYTRNEENGGGGGYYGGGGAGHDCPGWNDYDDSAAGGGSGYAKDTLTEVVGTSGTWSGDGKAVITPLGEYKKHTHTDACYSIGGNYLLTCTETEDPDADVEEITNFSYTGKIQSVTLKRGKYRLQVWGAQGGDGAAKVSNDQQIFGGKGGYSEGILNVSTATTIYVVVGGKGGTTVDGVGVATGGYNGGGVGTKTGGNTSNTQTAGGGGGATHIATKTGLLSALSSYKSNVLLVAGGGGGAGGWYGSFATEHSNGGFGGGLSGGTAKNVNNYSANGGTQTSGYSFGKGADATTHCDLGGGGGGYYGGYASLATSDAGICGGGGGSGYIGGVTDGKTIDGENAIPTVADANKTETGHSGDGYARITKIGGHKHTKDDCYIKLPDDSYKCDVTTPGTKSTYNSHVHTESCKPFDVYNCNNLPLNTNAVYVCDYELNDNLVTGTVSGKYGEKVKVNGVAQGSNIDKVVEFVAPKSGTYHLKAWGASGNDYDSTKRGGNGAYVGGDIHLEEGQKIYIYTGEEGQTTRGGYNGGANGNKSSGGMTYFSYSGDDVNNPNFIRGDSPIKSDDDTEYYGRCNNLCSSISYNLVAGNTYCFATGSYSSRTGSYYWMVQNPNGEIILSGVDNSVKTMSEPENYHYYTATVTGTYVFTAHGNNCNYISSSIRNTLTCTDPYTFLYTVTPGNLKIDENSVILLAGAGGGASSGGNGGDAGVIKGKAGANSTSSRGQGGTQTKAGLNGDKFKGGQAFTAGGAGGPGYYGGGAGEADGASGGGGSSYYANGVTNKLGQDGANDGQGRWEISYSFYTTHTHNKDGKVCEQVYTLHEHTEDCAKISYMSCGAIEKNRHVCVDDQTRMHRTYTVDKELQSRTLVDSISYPDGLTNFEVSVGGKAENRGSYTFIKADSAQKKASFKMKNLALDASVVDSLDITVKVDATDSRMFFDFEYDGGVSTTEVDTTKLHQATDTDFTTLTVTVPKDIPQDKKITGITVTVTSSVPTMSVHLRSVEFYTVVEDIKHSRLVDSFAFQGTLSGFARLNGIKHELTSKALLLTPTLANQGIHKGLEEYANATYNRIEVTYKTKANMTGTINGNAVTFGADTKFNTLILDLPNATSDDFTMYIDPTVATDSIEISKIVLKFKGTDEDDVALNTKKSNKFIYGIGDAVVTEQGDLGVLRNKFKSAYDFRADDYDFVTDNVTYSQAKGMSSSINQIGTVLGYNYPSFTKTGLNLNAKYVSYIDMTGLFKRTGVNESGFVASRVYFMTDAMTDFDTQHVLVAGTDIIYDDTNEQTVRFTTSTCDLWQGTITAIKVVPNEVFGVTDTSSVWDCSADITSLTLFGSDTGEIGRTWTAGPDDLYYAGTYEVTVQGRNLMGVTFKAKSTNGTVYPLVVIEESDTSKTMILSVTEDAEELQIIGEPTEMMPFDLTSIDIQGINMSEPILWCKDCHSYVRVYANGKEIGDLKGHKLATVVEDILFMVAIEGTGRTYIGHQGETCWVEKRVAVFGSEGKKLVLGSTPETDAGVVTSVVDEQGKVNGDETFKDLFRYTYIPDEICIESYNSMCEEPHHKGQHYDYSNTLCYDACNNDDNHKLKFPNHENQLEDPNGWFINLDYTFRICFPNTGDFEGIADFGLGVPSRSNGPGYTNDMDTTRWLREKRVKFPFNVIFLGPESADGTVKQDKITWQYIPANSWFDLPICDDQVWDNATSTWKNKCGNHTCFDEGENCSARDREHNRGCDCEVYQNYRFYCTLNNPEAKAAEVMFEVEAINCGTGGRERSEVDSTYGEIISANIPTMKNSTVNDNTRNQTNNGRTRDYTSLHGARGKNFIDIVGRIGNLMSFDTEDYRFSNLFKVDVNDSTIEWILNGIVPNVNRAAQRRYYGSTAEDIRGYTVGADSNWLNTYGTHEWLTKSRLYENDKVGFGDKSSVIEPDTSIDYIVERPLQYPVSPWDNQSTREDDKIQVDRSSKVNALDEQDAERTITLNYKDLLRNQYMRLGYNIFSSIETIGDYYNPDTSALQVVPYYYAIDMTDNTNKLIPVDAYIKTNGEYQPVNIFGNVKEDGNSKYVDYYMFTYQLNWADEAVRRLYSNNEMMITERIKEERKIIVPNEGNGAADLNEGGELGNTDVNLGKHDGTTIKEFSIAKGRYNLIGTAQRLYLGKLGNLVEGGSCRTFIGSPYTYQRTFSDEDGSNSTTGRYYVSDKDYKNDYLSGYMGNQVLDISDWAIRGQRWHFTLGLPSSTVFVPHNTAADAKDTWTKEDLTPVTKENMEAVSGDNFIIMMAVDIIVKGDKYVLQYQRPYQRNDKNEVLKSASGAPLLKESVFKLVYTDSKGDILTRTIDLNSMAFTKQPLVLYASNKSSEEDVAIVKTH